MAGARLRPSPPSFSRHVEEPRLRRNPLWSLPITGEGRMAKERVPRERTEYDVSPALPRRFA
jgi:hypothetical protein